MAFKKVTNEDLLAAYEAAKEENPDASQWAICKILGEQFGIVTGAVNTRIKRILNPESDPNKKTNADASKKVIKKDLDFPKMQNLKPEVCIGNKTGFKYKAQDNYLIINQSIGDKVGVLKITCIEDFIQELEDCKELYNQ